MQVEMIIDMYGLQYIERMSDDEIGIHKKDGME